VTGDSSTIALSRVTLRMSVERLLHPASATTWSIDVNGIGIVDDNAMLVNCQHPASVLSLGYSFS
jgi:hypothetical protein